MCVRVLLSGLKQEYAVCMKKKCHFCAEEVLIEAIKCKHCGELFGQKPKNFAGLKPKDYLKPPTVHCPNCGYTGLPQKVARGSGVIEVILWLCYLIPGLLYSVWRAGTKHYVCPKCGNMEIEDAVPVTPSVLPVSTEMAYDRKRRTILLSFWLVVTMLGLALVALV